MKYRFFGKTIRTASNVRKRGDKRILDKLAVRGRSVHFDHKVIYLMEHSRSGCKNRHLCSFNVHLAKEHATVASDAPYETVEGFRSHLYSTIGRHLPCGTWTLITERQSAVAVGDGHLMDVPAQSWIPFPVPRQHRTRVRRGLYRMHFSVTPRRQHYRRKAADVRAQIEHERMLRKIE